GPGRGRPGLWQLLPRFVPLPSADRPPVVRASNDAVEPVTDGPALADGSRRYAKLASASFSVSYTSNTMFNLVMTIKSRARFPSLASLMAPFSRVAVVWQLTISPSPELSM